MVRKVRFSSQNTNFNELKNFNIIYKIKNIRYLLKKKILNL